MKRIIDRVVKISISRALIFSNLSISRNHYTSLKRGMPQPEVANFRLLNNERFSLSFRFLDPQKNEDRVVVFQRNIQEELEKFLQRLRMKVNEQKSKKKTFTKRKNGDHTADLTVQLLKEGAPVSNNLICADIFRHDMKEKLILKIGAIEYIIAINRPWVESAFLPQVIMAGFPVYPYKIKLWYCNEHESEFLWFRQPCSHSPEALGPIASGFTYIPSVDDIGCHLQLRCIPKRNGIEGEYVSTTSVKIVSAGPGKCPFENRHLFTKNVLTNNSFRVVSYNILADLYASSETGKHEIFVYCPSYALELHYRKLLLLRELLGYNADLICLQEVDCKVFDRDLCPILKTAGMDGLMTKKGKQVNEGVACFYRKSRFKLVSNHSLLLGEGSQSETCLKNIWDRVSQNEILHAALAGKTTAAQILVFEFLDNPNHKLIIGNTHLYFHPEADHLRLLQAGMCLSVVNNLKNTIEKEEPGSMVSVIFSGDFNSTPDCGVYKLFTKSIIPEDYQEWKSDTFVNESVTGISLHNPIKFKSACGIPDYTNFTPNFIGCLDYIFYAYDSLLVEQVVPFPQREEVNQFVAIPSIVFPSDHIALVADFKWK